MIFIKKCLTFGNSIKHRRISLIYTFLFIKPILGIITTPANNFPFFIFFLWVLSL